MFSRRAWDPSLAIGEDEELRDWLSPDEAVEESKGLRIYRRRD